MLKYLLMTRVDGNLCLLREPGKVWLIPVNMGAN